MNKLKKLYMVYLAAFSNNNSLIIEICPLNSVINTSICTKEKLKLQKKNAWILYKSRNNHRTMVWVIHFRQTFIVCMSIHGVFHNLILYSNNAHNISWNCVVWFIARINQRQQELLSPKRRQHLWIQDKLEDRLILWSYLEDNAV